MSVGRKDDKAQSDRFREAARELGVDDAADVDEVVRRLAKQKPQPRNGKTKDEGKSGS